METSQVIFSLALGAIAVLITLFAAYVVWTTMWGDRWYGRRR